MSRWGYHLCLIVCTAASGAGAETCVGAHFGTPFPGATDVDVRRVDVPSSTFPGIWQEGRINGYFFQIWANGEALLQPSETAPDWNASVICQGDDCQRGVTGTPPADALEVLQELETCLNDATYAGRPAAVDPAPDDPSPETPISSDETDPDNDLGDVGALDPAVEPNSPTADETNSVPPAALDPDPAPCGLANIPDGPPGLTLQRLLVEAGADPGNLDGLPGPRTYRALFDVLGAEAERTTIEAAIERLNTVVCTPTE